MFYHDSPDYHDGDVREVSEQQFAELISNFPDNFFPVAEEKAIEDKNNKAIEGKKNK